MEGTIPFQRMAAEQRADLHPPLSRASGRRREYGARDHQCDTECRFGIGRRHDRSRNPSLCGGREAEPASCFQRMYRAFQETTVCASTMNLPRKCRSAAPRFDGRATASPFDATRTSEALVRVPAAEILGIRSFHRIQKPESLSAASKNPHSCPRPRAAWHHPPGQLSANTGADLCLAPKLPTICHLWSNKLSVPAVQLPATSRSSLSSRGP